MATGEDALIVLRSIDASLKAILALVQAQTPKPNRYGQDENGCACRCMTMNAALERTTARGADPVSRRPR